MAFFNVKARNAFNVIGFVKLQIVRLHCYLDSPGYLDNFSLKKIIIWSIIFTVCHQPA